VYYVVVIYRNT